ncbi:uncharacterized protein LOC143223307 [Tachypleus tridentatus]|uniref:uncharacterized protein LOC143223307 n=1 Tax=Tachypleus tridentatus TaxID=6853 RepID=UPI003FD4B347
MLMPCPCKNCFVKQRRHNERTSVNVFILNSSKGKITQHQTSYLKFSHVSSRARRYDASTVHKWLKQMNIAGTVRYPYCTASRIMKHHRITRNFAPGKIYWQMPKYYSSSWPSFETG